MVAAGIEPPSLLVGASGVAEWWCTKKVADLHLPTAVTVHPSLSCAEAMKMMSSNGFDQLPVVDSRKGVVGVVTLRNLMSKLAHTAASQPVEKFMFQQQLTCSSLLPSSMASSLYLVHCSRYFNYGIQPKWFQL
jgi:predicted transcriptional regulator